MCLFLRYMKNQPLQPKLCMSLKQPYGKHSISVSAHITWLLKQLIKSSLDKKLTLVGCPRLQKGDKCSQPYQPNHACIRYTISTVA